MGSQMWVEGEQLFFIKPVVLGAILLPTLKGAHSCWSQPRLPACDCEVLFWKDKWVWIWWSCLNFRKIEQFSIFIKTLEKHQNEVPKLPRPHDVARMWFGCLCVDRPCGTGTMSGEVAQAHTSLPWAPGNPLEMLIVESTLICINYANRQLPPLWFRWFSCCTYNFTLGWHRFYSLQ